MNGITVTNRDGIYVTTSMEVAEMVGKLHKNLLRDIEGYINDLTALSEDNEFNQLNFEPVDFFIKSSYVDDKGETRPCYLITKKGCEFIAHKLTGKKGTLFTAAYITAFHEMEDALMSQNQPSYMIEDPKARTERWIEEATEKLELMSQNKLLEVSNHNLTIANKNLSGEILSISDRKKLRRIVCCLANKVYPNLKNRYCKVYNELYTQLRYGCSIDLKMRASKSGKKNEAIISYIRDDEWDDVNKTMIAIIESYGFNAGEFIEDCKIIKGI